MTLRIEMAEWPVAAMAVGAGIWVYFLWALATAEPDERIRAGAEFGVVGAGAFGGGLLGSLVVGTVGLSSLGALVGGTVAAAVVVHTETSSGVELLDRLVPGGVAGLSVARIGCLLEGCDFGRPVEEGLAVVYGPESRAWAVHFAEYGLSPSSAESLAVHPFAAYLAGWGLMCAAAGEWLRRRSAGTGRAAIPCALAFLIGGGAIEWLREPATVLQITDGVSLYPMLYWLAAGFVVVVRDRLKSGEQTGVAP